jgi:hypothetical protein
VLMARGENRNRPRFGSRNVSDNPLSFHAAW